MLKRAHKGVYHKISAKHLQRYVDKFAGRHGVRERNTLDQMQSVVAGMAGMRLSYRELVADQTQKRPVGLHPARGVESATMHFVY